MLDLILELVINLIPLSLRDRINKRKEWTGVAEEIKQSGDLLPTKRSVLVVFRREDGSTIRVKMRRDESLSYALGQRYRKHSGESLPRPILPKKKQ